MLNFGEYTLLLVILSFTYGQEDIRMPPYITTGPKSSIIFRSEVSVKLECKGKGIPNVTYEWKKNGFDLNRNALNIKSGADGTITIEPATSIDEGYYQCFVRNQYGTALSNISHIQRARLDFVSGTPTVHEKSVNEGEPFFIEAQTRKSFPKPTYGWEIANDARDIRPTAFNPSNRTQIDDNGNLHFAYAKPEDDLAGRIYTCTTYNQYLDIKAGGSYTKVVVTANNSRTFAPTIGFSSEPQTVGIIGESASFRCFFYGKSEPSISWKGPNGSLPINRWTLDKFYSELTISYIRASDQGDYTCTASNTGGQSTHTIQLRVEAKPSFKTVSLGPHNINVTDGDDAVFTCDAAAIPEAKVVWLQNGNVLDFNAPPKKFYFSSDRRTLTIRSVCRDCGDPDRQTDLSVIQCNASNIHGYVFGSGYLNVLAKTQIIPADKIKVSVGIYEKKRFDFGCSAVSDPSTPVTLRWYRLIEGREQMVYNEPPFITLIQSDGVQSLTLSVFVSPNGTEKWLEYHGEYRCNASNGYSNAAKWASIEVIKSYADPPYIHFLIYVVAIVATCLVIIIIIIVCICCRRRRESAYKATTKEIHVTPHYETLLGDGYETIPCDILSANQSPSHVGQVRQTTENVRRSNAVESVYATITDNTDDPEYDDCIATAEGEKENILPSSTDQYDGNAQLKDDYTGLNDRDNAYKTMYTGLQQGAEIGTLRNPPTTTAALDENTEEKSDYTGFTDRENAYITVYTDMRQDDGIQAQENPLPNNEN